MQRGVKLHAYGLAYDRQGHKCNAAAGDQSYPNADSGNGGNLSEEVQENAKPAGAHAAQHGDHAGPLGDIGGYAGPDTHASDQERGQPDNHKEAHEQVVVVHHRSQPFAGGAHDPARI